MDKKILILGGGAGSIAETALKKFPQLKIQVIDLFNLMQLEYPYNQKYERLFGKIYN